MVLVIALKDFLQPCPDHRWRRVHPAAQLLLDGPQLCHHSLVRRFATDGEGLSISDLRAVMREAQKRERLRFSRTSLLPVQHSEPTEFDQPRLLGMYFQSELGQPIPKFIEESLSLRPALETDNEIVGIADDNDIATCHFPAPGFDPQVKDVMEIDIRQQG